MQCIKCGAILKEGANFCTSCGNPVTHQVETAVSRGPDSVTTVVLELPSDSEATVVVNSELVGDDESEDTVLLSDYEAQKQFYEEKPVKSVARKRIDYYVPPNTPMDKNPNFVHQQEKNRKRTLLIVLASIVGMIILMEAIFLFILNHRNSVGVEPEAEVILKTQTDEKETEILEEEKPQETVKAEETEESAEELDKFHQILEWIDVNDNGMLGLDYMAPKQYYPAVRDTSLTWDKTLFYTLEDVSQEKADDGQINYYKVGKKQAYNTVNKNLIDFEVYAHPVSGDIQKIVAIEHCDGYLDIYEYYFRDGKLNFIFQSTNVVYTPTYATPDKPGCRYYYNNDVLVQFRGVDANKNLQNFYVDKLDTYDSTFQISFNEVEANMLNRAYIIYNFIRTIPEVGYIKGYVLNENNEPVEGATISAYLDEEKVNTVYSRQDGYYILAVPADEMHQYNLVIRDGDKEEEQIYAVDISPDHVLYYAENVYTFDNYDTTYDVEVLLCDAFNESGQYVNDVYSKMVRLSDAVLNIRRGNNNRTGEIILSTTADVNGFAYVNLPAGNYTGEIVKDGYENSYFTITVKPDNLFVQSITSPSLGEGEVRIVLTWGEYPEDLDSHLFTPHWGENGDMQHIGYYEREDSFGNNLDVDDVTSYGPETITINSVTDGLYKYFVKDFTNCRSQNYTSMDMSYSGATVFVFSGSGQNTVFHVPVGEPGVIWEVFEIRNKQIIPIQRYYANVNDKNW